MNNLSRILKTYFVDADFDSIVNAEFRTDTASTFPEKGMSDDDFVKILQKDDFVYGFDVAKAINRSALTYGLKNENGKKSVFNILSSAVEEMLDYKNDEPICKQEHFLRWNEISRIVGEDLLTLAFLASNNKKYSNLNSFAWKPFIRSDSTAVNSILDKGLYELHSHLFGASLNIDVNWLALMNSAQMDKKYKKELSKKFPSELLIAKKAIALRYCLFAKLQGKNPQINLYQILKSKNPLQLESLLQNCYQNIRLQKQNALHFEKKVIDYAIPKNITQRDSDRYYNVPLIGERILLYKALREIYTSEKKRDDYSRLLYAYIIAKNLFRKIIVQCDQIKGFGYFSEVQDRKNLFEKNKFYSSLILFMAVQNVVCNQPIKKMEMRFSPQKTANGIIQGFKSEKKNIIESFRRGKENKIASDVKLGYIFHFIKKDEKKDKIKFSNFYCRNHSVRDTVNKQATAIESLIRANSPYIVGGIDYPQNIKPKHAEYPVVGIDAASSEFYCRPEVFAPSFRRLKYVQRNTVLDYMYSRIDAQLGRTYHAGEDFYDIVDGLRAIDECINFMNFGEGDRIGHGVALGVNASNYYEERDFRIILPKQDMLDNAVWMHKMMEFYSIPDEYGLKANLRKIFRELFYEIYSDVFNSKNELESTSISDYYDSWQLRGDDPATILGKEETFKPYMLGDHDELKIIRKIPKIRSLFRAYHYSGSAKKKGAECKEFHLHEGYDKVVEQLQKKLRERIQKKHISIETNPTSNMQITDVDRYAEHPITVLNNSYLKAKPDSMIDVSINTDDQGVFATSLEKEFTLMALALEKEKDRDGNQLYSTVDIYRWLDSIRESACFHSFL